MPGSTSTQIDGINGNILLGFASNVGGFEYDGTTVKAINYPISGAQTFPVAMSGNTVVGYYDIGPNTTHGFTYNGSTFTTLDVPGSPLTQLFGISGNIISGSFYDSSGTLHGFTYNGSTFTQIDVPGAMNTFVAGIDGQTVVGGYNTPVDIPFFYDGTTFTTISIPNLNDGDASAVSGNTIVGAYQIANGGTQFGFEYTINNVPEPTSLAKCGLLAAGVAAWRRRWVRRPN